MAEVIGALRWYLECDGIQEGVFREVGGLDATVEVIENRVTGKGGNLIVQKIPGSLKWSNLTLKRGITDDPKIHEWMNQIAAGGVEANRKNGTITCFAPDGSVVAKYTFKRAWPCKWSGPMLDANKNELAVESLELCHEGLERQQ